MVTTTVTSRSVALRGPSTTREVRYTARAYTTAVATTARAMPRPARSSPPPTTTAVPPRIAHGVHDGSSPTRLPTDGSTASRARSCASRSVSGSVPVLISWLPRTRGGG